MKRGNNLIKDWRERWFVLDETHLHYYKGKDMGHLIASIELKDCVASVADKFESKAFCFQISTKAGRSYWMEATDSKDMMNWINAINSRNGVSPALNVSEERIRRGSLVMCDFNKDEAIRKGYLYKIGNNRKKDWKRRWFVLYQDLLEYYIARTDSSPKGIIDLVSCSVQQSDLKPNSFSIQTPNRAYFVYADNEQQMEQWMRDIRTAINRLLRNLEKEEQLLPPSIDTVKEGWLLKQGKNVIGDWRKRWCVLRPNTFDYYKSPSVIFSKTN